MTPAASGSIPHIANVQPDSGSDSDSSDGSTSSSISPVSLGLPDGPLETDDELNPLVSRIGGRAAWLPVARPPPEEVAKCAHCARSMQLLVQIFAPLVDSPYDRTLLIWGCARAVCQRKGRGSIRVIRLLQHNARWASKLEKQRQRRMEREQRQAAKEAERERRKKEAEAIKGAPGANPFAMGAGAAGAMGLFGKADFKSSPFAAALATGAKSPDDNGGQVGRSSDEGSDEGADDDDENEDENEDEDDDEAERLAEELAVKASLQEKRQESDTWSSGWASRSSFYSPAQYLNTISEPDERSVTRSTKSKAKGATETVSESIGSDKTSGAGEKYESTRVPGVDAVFERFARRVGLEGRQIVRYEWNGTPLPFAATGPTYDRLWPRASSAGGQAGSKVTLPNGRAATLVGHANSHTPTTTTKAERMFDPKTIPACEACGAARTFELQMMPNLVNLLRPDSIHTVGEDGQKVVEKEADDEETTTSGVGEAEKRRREIERALGRSLPPLPGADGVTRASEDQQPSKGNSDLPPRTGLAWATAFVFVCAEDCCFPRKDTSGESWREEWVEVQWEDD